MSAEERIRLCLLLEKMEKFPEYSRRLGIKDASRFLGKQITEITGKQREYCDEKLVQSQDRKICGRYGL